MRTSMGLTQFILCFPPDSWKNVGLGTGLCGIIFAIINILLTIILQIAYNQILKIIFKILQGLINL